MEFSKRIITQYLKANLPSETTSPKSEIGSGIRNRKTKSKNGDYDVCPNKFETEQKSENGINVNYKQSSPSSFAKEDSIENDYNETEYKPTKKKKKSSKHSKTKAHIFPEQLIDQDDQQNS